MVLGIFISIFWVHSNLGVLGLCEHHDVFGIAVGLYIRWVEVSRMLDSYCENGTLGALF